MALSQVSLICVSGLVNLPANVQYVGLQSVGLHSNLVVVVIFLYQVRFLSHCRTLPVMPGSLWSLLGLLECMYKLN